MAPRVFSPANRLSCTSSPSNSSLTTKTSPPAPPTRGRSANPGLTSGRGGTTGPTNSSSSSPAWATASASATSGASHTSATRVEEVNILVMCVHLSTSPVAILETNRDREPNSSSS
ncbi:cell wall integrity and stress response component 1-like [Homalodisca vitripennis]|uniref:cell wall integrity and stress response component 1-like n=1 Tax=Homalodisca vitripennis TaxID=197043 RepID=UPI001EEA7313|nr:cell wall integrity and stress response component 1-like [Homalodisca vitripennis]XP_046687498.1 cell wall integrity and stress response component 1-like [Homalodisca vitripennis]XP_046687499.1 cell wall integrity and stress response component 1-like [Homalodisca vitripennis]XP_046687500.1 cell wall integrity and stress response component 1-like [Homalodisca vitripennis]XP_046687501.1 cell wall integrity and stress response component 1-like [Homalodisca vitripennis]